MQSSLVLLSPLASTGNNTHPSADGSGAVRAAVQFVVEAVGATPTVTWKVQGSVDNSNWYDVEYVTDATDTAAAATRTAAAVGAQIEWLDLDTRFYNRYRLVVTLNTNVTYHGELYFLR